MSGKHRRSARPRAVAGGKGRGLLRYPRTVLALSTLAIAALALLGRGVEDRLSPTSLEISGTPSERGTELLRSHFGDSAPFAILLQGPPQEIERQGPELVRALHRADPAISTLSPWDRGSVGPLRPGPRRALVIADFHVDLPEAVNQSVDQLNAILAAEVRPPLRATQTSYATLSRQIQDRSIEAAERSELIALPILLIVLLLVFRSPIAAAIPLLFGAATVAASRGLLYLIAGAFEVDAFALTVCTMMGLALGVDYALLMVSRFREELANGAAPREGRRPHPPHRRAHHRLRGIDPDALDAGRLLHRPRLAARIAGGDRHPRRRPQRRDRDHRRPRRPSSPRSQRGSLAPRRRPRRGWRGVDGLRLRRPAPPDRRLARDRRGRPRPRRSRGRR